MSRDTLLVWKTNILKAMSLAPLSPEEQEAEAKQLKQKALQDARKAFDSKYKSSWQRLDSVKKLRGADIESTMKEQIAQLEQTLATAKNQADSATEPQDILDARDLLDALVDKKAKVVEEASKRFERDFNADLEAMKTYPAMLGAARKSREEIAKLPGSQEQLLAIERLLAEGQSKLITDGKLTRGHAVAVRTLAGHVQLLKTAQTQSQEYLNNLDGEIDALRIQVGTKIGALRKTAPEFQATLYEQKLAEAVNQSKSNPTQAKERILQLGVQAEDEVRALAELKDKAEHALGEIEKKISKLEELQAPPSMYTEIAWVVKQVKTVDIPGREYQRGLDRLTDAEASADSVIKFVTENKQWATEKTDELGRMIVKCGEFEKWKPLSQQAKQLAQAAEALKAKLAKPVNVEELTRELNALAGRFKDLETAAAEGVPKDLDLGKFDEVRAEAGREVDQARQETYSTVVRLGKKLTAEGVKNAENTPLHQEFRTVGGEWEQFLDRPPTTEGLAEELTRRKTQTVQKFADLRGRIDDLLSKQDKAGELGSLIEESKKADQVQVEMERPKRLEKLFAELAKLEELAKTRGDTPENKQLKKSLTGLDRLQQIMPGLIQERARGSKTPQEIARIQQNLETKLNEMLVEARKAFAETQKNAARTIQGISDALDRFASDNPAFRQYIAELKLQAGDVTALVESGDPFYYEQAIAESKILVKKMVAIDPDKRPKDAKTYEDTRKKWTEMERLLNKDDLVKTRLPGTYQRLDAALKKTIASAQSTSPEGGLQLLEPLRAEITEYQSIAVIRDGEYKFFEEQKKLAETQFAEVLKKAGSLTGGRAKAFEAKVQALFAEATALAAASETPEGNEMLAKAVQKLDAVTQLLDEIDKAPNPQEALQNQDVLATREKELVADMARQFKAQLEAYEGVTLPNLRQLMKSAKDADLTQVDSLAKVGQQARTIVEPYLKIISKWPHDFLRADASPLVDKATADFARARAMLDQANRTTGRLALNPEGTNVTVSADIKKVASYWTEQVNAYGTGVRKLAEAIETAAKEVPEDTDKPKIDQAIQKAVAELAEATKHFSSSAFAEPMGKLADDKAGAKDRLAARESALRLVRQYTQDVLTHPILVKINDPKNPFANLSRETSMLRTALKKLELAVLVGV